MLTFHSRQSGGRTCEGFSRRNFLKVGGLSVGGLTMADLLRLRAGAARAGGPARARSASAKSVIMVWLEGGPSHIDTYDLKPAAPAEIRGPFRPIPTCVPGMEFC